MSSSLDNKILWLILNSEIEIVWFLNEYLKKNPTIFQSMDMRVTVKMVQILRIGLLNMMYSSLIKKKMQWDVLSHWCWMHCCIRNSVFSQFRKIQGFFCHGAKETKVTFGWYETDRCYIQSYLASVLVWKDASSFSSPYYS